MEIDSMRDSRNIVITVSELSNGVDHNIIIRFIVSNIDVGGNT